MKTCELCGNVYDKCIDVVLDGSTHSFDCFECAIQALAPLCQRCSCRVIGHGVESNGRIYCCAHCASREGVSALRDRA